MGKETVMDQYGKLYKIKEWLFDQLREEDDRQLRNTLFAATQAIGLAMISLEKVEFLIVGDNRRNDGT